MLPRPTKYDMTDRRLAHTKSLGKFFVLHAIAMQFANLTYLGFCKFGRSASAFLISVKHVFSLGSSTQMIRTYASRIVAFMNNEKSAGDGLPVFELPHQSVGVEHLAVEFEKPVSVSVLGSGPQPARFGFLNSAQKSFVLFNGHLHLGAL